MKARVLEYDGRTVFTDPTEDGYSVRLAITDKSGKERLVFVVITAKALDGCPVRKD